MQVIIHTGLYSELSILSAQQGHVNVFNHSTIVSISTEMFFL